MRFDLHSVTRPAWITLVAALTLACHSSRRTETKSVTGTIGKGFITGTASYLERIALANGAVFEAVLQDVSRPDAPATAIGLAVVEQVSHLPISFSIEFDSAQVNPRRNYVVRTRILEDGKPKWVSDRAHPVLTQGNGTSVRIAMRRVGVSEQVGPDGGDLLLGGELTYLADVARLMECRSRRIYPVSNEGDFPEMLSSYTKMARSIGAPLFVTFEGVIVDRMRITGSGMTSTAVVNDHIEAWPAQSCATSAANAPLLGTRWHIVRIENARTSEVTGQQDPVLLLNAGETSLTYSATAGCASIRGSVQVTGDQIAFGPNIETSKSCGGPLDALASRLVDALQKAVHWQILGRTLDLEDISGETVATFEIKPDR